MMRLSAASLLVALSVLLHPSHALAQTPDADKDVEEKKAEARARFDRGIALFNEGAYDTALAEFIRSRELFPTRAAVQNAALALRKLHRPDESLEMLEELLRAQPDMPEGARRAIEQEIAELRPLVATISVTASELGATVVIDGRERGTTPLSGPVRVAAGSHLVRVYKEGFLPFETRVTVAGSTTSSVEARLGALTRGGRLAVTEEHGLALDVVVDGMTVGKTPWEGTLPVGSHTVTLRGEGEMGSQPASATIRLNQLTKLSLVAEPLSCSLRVVPTPVGASVAIDGVDVGHGLWQGPLRCGGHEVEIAEEGFLPFRRNVSLVQGKATTVVETLARDPTSPLWRARNPPRVTIDARAGGLLGPSLGGDLNRSCADGCSAGLAAGAAFMARFGYRLGVGLGFAADAGFLFVGRSLQDRSASVTPLGLPPHPGRADDELGLSGPTLGASVSLERGERIVWSARLGGGVFLGTWSDERTGDFATTTGIAYRTPRRTERGGAAFAYVNPELAVGYRLGKSWVATLGLQALLLVGLSDARWSDAAPVSAGLCPDPDVNRCAGQGGYGPSEVIGKMVVLASPFGGVRYEF